MQHECTVCNTPFESKSAKAKYCPDCKSLSPAKRKEKTAELAIQGEKANAVIIDDVTPVPEYKSPDVLPPTGPAKPVQVKVVERPSGRRVCDACGAEYTVKHGKGGCPLCALDSHFGMRRR